MSASVYVSEPFNVDAAVLAALEASSPLEIETLSAAGVSHKRIKRAWKEAAFKRSGASENVSRNYEALKDWSNQNKRSKDRVNAVLSQIFRLDTPETAKREIELFLEAGGTMRQVREFLSETPLPQQPENQIAFLENVTTIAELEKATPDTKKTHSKSIFSFSKSHRARGTQDTVEQLKQKITQSWASNTSLIVLAVRTGHEKVAMQLLKLPKPSEAIESKHFEALKQAIDKENHDELESLLLIGFDPNSIGPDSNNLLIHCILNGKSWAIPLLLEHGADPDKPDGNSITPLHYAVNLGNNEAVNALIEHGADVNHQGIEGMTPLHRVRYLNTNEQRLQMWELLISKGADPRLRDLFEGRGCNTPLVSIFHWGPLDFAMAMFAGYPVIIEIMTDKSDVAKVDLLRAAASELIQPNVTSPNLLPLEIPFLMQDHQLAVEMLALMPEDAVREQIAAIREKYPHVSPKLLIEGYVESKRDYALQFGETSAYPVNTAPYDGSKTEKVKRLLAMLDKILLKEGHPDGLKFEGDHGYSSGPKYKDYLKKPEDPGYRDISEFKDANGRVFTPLLLRAKMVCLIRDIENRQPKPGTPSHEKQTELEHWYRYLESTLCEIIDIVDVEDGIEATSDDPTPNASTIIEIALTGGNCGGWMMGESQKIKQQKKHLELGLQHEIMTVLKSFHESICESFVSPEDAQNTHVMNLVYQVIDESAGIKDEQKGQRYYFLDPLPAANRAGQKRNITRLYWKDSSPPMVIDEVYRAINIEHSVDRELVIDWLGENVPNGWSEETMIKMRADVASADTIDDKCRVLREKYGIYIKMPKPIEEQVLNHLLNGLAKSSDEHQKLYDKYKKAMMLVASMRSNAAMACKLLNERYGFELDPNQPLIPQVQNAIAEQLPSEEKERYTEAMQVIEGKSYSDAASLIKFKYGLEIEKYPDNSDIDRAMSQWRSSDFIAALISDSGHISRRAITYLLTGIGVFSPISAIQSPLELLTRLDA